MESVSFTASKNKTYFQSSGKTNSLSDSNSVFTFETGEGESEGIRCSCQIDESEMGLKSTLKPSKPKCFINMWFIGSRYTELNTFSSTL